MKNSEDRSEKARASTRWTVGQADAGARVDAWLAGRPEVGSRTRAREWIERGKVFVNDVELTFDRAGERVRAGDEIVVWVDRPGSSRPRSRDVVAHRGQLRIVFEDARLLVADKPPGLLVEPLPRGEPEVTLRDLVSNHLGARALVVHRIDRDTSGLVVFAKDEAAREGLKRQFERRTAERVYLTVLHGRLSPPEGVWKDTLTWDKAHLVQRRSLPGDERGKEAVAAYTVVEQFPGAALVRVSLGTGKRNQIRIQAALHGHPLVGERIYRKGVGSSFRESKSAPNIDFARQALHAARLAFRDPETGRRLQFDAPLPDDMQRLIAAVRRARRSSN